MSEMRLLRVSVKNCLDFLVQTLEVCTCELKLTCFQTVTMLNYQVLKKRKKFNLEYKVKKKILKTEDRGSLRKDRMVRKIQLT